MDMYSNTNVYIHGLYQGPGPIVQDRVDLYIHFVLSWDGPHSVRQQSVEHLTTTACTTYFKGDPR